MSEDKKKIIADDEEHFPSRFLTVEEKKLLVAKLLRYTTTSIANTLPPEIRLDCALADSNMIQRFMVTENDELAEFLFMSIGAQIRQFLSNRPEALGLEKKSQFVINTPSIIQ